MRGSQSSTLYISVDLETSGNFPHCHFITEIGVVAFDSHGNELDTLQLYLSAPDGKVFDPDTHEWYKKQPGYPIWAQHAELPKNAMEKLQVWVKQHMKGKSKLAWIAYPTIFDGTWLTNYWFQYLGHPQGGRGPGFTFVDIRSFGAGKLDVDVFAASKQKALEPFRPSEQTMPHTHSAVDDAREQGHLFFNIVKRIL